MGKEKEQKRAKEQGEIRREQSRHGGEIQRKAKACHREQG